jgi:glycine oxidase
VLGATMEERGFDTTATAGAVFEMLRDAIELVPGVGEFVIEELMVGTRPGTADNGPVLGPSSVGGLHWATGHHRHGILLTPLTAEVVTAGLLGEAPPDVAEPFRATRFAPAQIGA